MKKLWNKDYILLLQGSVVSTIGDLMYSVAIGYWVYDKTGSNALMGIMSSISMFVFMFLSPFAGNIIDKCNRKWILVGMDLLQSVIMVTIGVLAYFDKLNVPGVLIAALLASLGSVFYSPASSTLMLDIIPHDDMVRGQSIYSGAHSFINLVGSAFSGVMVAFFGVPLIIIINGMSNLYSAITELFINVPRTVSQGEKVSVRGILGDFSLAIKSIFSDECLQIFVPCALLINLLGAGSLSLMLPFCLEKGFTVDMYGYLMSIWTAASLICVVILGSVKFSPKARYIIMAVGLSSSAIFMIAAYLSNNFILTSVLAFISAFTNSAGNTVFNASLMLALPEKNRGSILGFFNSACIGGSALSTVIYGFLGEIFPLYITFSIGSFLSLAPMIFLCFNKKTRDFIISH